jgi:PKD repeat protein
MVEMNGPGRNSRRKNGLRLCTVSARLLSSFLFVLLALEIGMPARAAGLLQILAAVPDWNGAPVESVITVTFDQPVALGSFGGSINGAAINPAQVTANGDATIITVDPGTLQYGTTYNVVILGTTASLADNQVTLGSNHPFSFTVEAAPPPPLPSSFHGEIHMLAAPASEGNKVEIYLPGESDPIASPTISPYNSMLVYWEDVPGDIHGTAAREGAVEAEQLTFKINGRTVGTAEWHSGTSTELNLHPPEAQTGGPYSGTAGTAITFHALADDWGNDAIKYEWDWDNNGSFDETAQNPAHTFANAGDYSVGLKVTDAQGGEGTGTALVTVNQIHASVTLGNLLQVFDGTSKAVSVSTNPPGLSVSITYNGSSTPPSATGSYAVAASVTDPNYSGSASGTLVIEARQSLVLLEGWNLVSLNVHPYNTAIAAVLADISGHYDLVYAWDATGGHSASGNWTKYSPPPAPGYQNSLLLLDETMGFWIHMTTADILDVAGSAPTTSSIPLLDDVGGWNLVGYPSMANRALPAALRDFGAGTNYKLVYAYHAYDTSDLWKLYDPHATYSNDLLQITPGWAYWINMTSDCSWSIPYLPE